MKENGRMIRRMATEFIFIRMELDIKANGKMINNMAMVLDFYK